MYGGWRSNYQHLKLLKLLATETDLLKQQHTESCFILVLILILLYDQIYNSIKINIQENHCCVFIWLRADYFAVPHTINMFFSHITVGGAQAWASAGQPTLADRIKWPTPTTTRMGPTRQPLALMRHHKGLQVPITPLFQFSFDSRTSVLVIGFLICAWLRIFHYIFFFVVFF